MSDKRDRAIALAALVEAFGVHDFSPVRTRTYEDGLKDIPMPLLNAAVRRAIATRTFFPKVSELRLDAEYCRKELIAAHPYQACMGCHGSGWVPVEVDGIKRVQRCNCWHVHQQRLVRLGVTSTALALPEPERVRVGDE